MTRAYVARTIVALMLLSTISGVVLADDAGSGSDAGGSMSTATWLPSSSNATYYGNLSSNDTSDYFGFNLSSDNPLKYSGYFSISNGVCISNTICLNFFI